MDHAINLTHDGILKIRIPEGFRINKVQVEVIGTDKTVDYESVVRCKDCKYYPMCIMSAPDGNWKACDDFEPKDERGDNHEND